MSNPNEKALVEMKNIDDAIRLFEDAKKKQIVLFNAIISVSYSVHKELKQNPMDYTPSNILLVTICGYSQIPFSLNEMASVLISKLRTSDI